MIWRAIIHDIEHEAWQGVKRPVSDFLTSTFD